MEERPIICKNCETHNPKDAKFCINCGQKIGDQLTFGLLFYNTIGNYFSFDARFFRSIIPLLFRPGYIAKEFVKGRRLQYLHPGQMYLFVTVIFFFVFNFYVREGREVIEKNAKTAFQEIDKDIKRLDTIAKIDPAILDTLKIENAKDAQKLINDIQANKYQLKDTVAKTTNNNNPVQFNFERSVVDSLIAINAPDEEIYKSMGMDENAGYFTRRFYSQGLKLYKTMGFAQVYQYFIDSIPLAMFFLMPLFAFILKLFYFKKGNYAHHLVFSFYFFCFLFTIFSLVLGANKVFEGIPASISWLIILSTYFYLWRSIVNFYQQNWFISFIKSGIISGIYLLFVIPLAFVIILFISFLFY
jgi:hypothetical protein